jgi:alpha-D-xyloside xylohydrolase
LSGTQRFFLRLRGMLRRLHARDLKVSVWINPYVAQPSRLFAEGVAVG